MKSNLPLLVLLIVGLGAGGTTAVSEDHFPAHYGQHGDHGHSNGHNHGHDHGHSHSHGHDHYKVPHYVYGYGVHDGWSGDVKSVEEERHGGWTRGGYSLLQSNGAVRSVKYVVDPWNGFQAVVHNKGWVGGQHHYKHHSEIKSHPLVFNPHDDHHHHHHNHIPHHPHDKLDSGHHHHHLSHLNHVHTKDCVHSVPVPIPVPVPVPVQFHVAVPVHVPSVHEKPILH